MIAALITLYNPEQKVAENVKTIAPQVDRVFLCDNSQTDNHDMFAELDNAEYIFNGHNYALSKAFNIVLTNNDYGWTKDDYIVFFDQDSAIEKGHIDGLLKEYEYLESLGYNVGCIGPIYYDLNTDSLAVPRVKKQITEENYIVSSIITSSMLCKFKDIEDIGFWNEDIFLDLADWDLCWRFMKANKVCIKTKTVVLKHALGFGEKKVGPIKLGKSAPIREYYQTRNYLILLRKSYTPIKYKIKFIRNLTIRPVLHLLFLDNKIERMKYILAGLRDFRKEQYGEYNKQ